MFPHPKLSLCLHHSNHLHHLQGLLLIFQLHHPSNSIFFHIFNVKFVKNCFIIFKAFFWINSKCSLLINYINLFSIFYILNIFSILVGNFTAKFGKNCFTNPFYASFPLHNHLNLLLYLIQHQ